jgi:ecdysteroid 25-hydroxylase CYP306A1
MKLGNVFTVVLSDQHLIRQAFARDIFVGRAPLYLTHGIMKGYGECFFFPFFESETGVLSN